METITMEMRGPIARAVVESVEQVTGERLHQCHKQAAVCNAVVNTMLGGDYSIPMSAQFDFVKTLQPNGEPMPFAELGIKGRPINGHYPRNCSTEHTWLYCRKSDEFIDLSLFQYKEYFKNKFNVKWEWDRNYFWGTQDRIKRGYQPFYIYDLSTTQKIMNGLYPERESLKEMAALTLRKIEWSGEPTWPLWWLDTEAELDTAFGQQGS